MFCPYSGLYSLHTGKTKPFSSINHCNLLLSTEIHLFLPLVYIAHNVELDNYQCLLSQFPPTCPVEIVFVLMKGVENPLHVYVRTSFCPEH